MSLEHACFISFPRGPGKDALFAHYFFEEFTQHLAALDERLSVFKVDRCEHRRQGDDWTLWIQRELCGSAMMIAVCAPNYFNGAPGCVSEFRGMETLIGERTRALGGQPVRDWLIALRLKDTFPMPPLNPYDVQDFLDCLSSPEKVKRVRKYRLIVEDLATRVYKHWLWLHDRQREAQLAAAKICTRFTLPPPAAAPADAFPHSGGIR